MPCMEGANMKDARKLTALFVALIMILGMFPMASAELTNCSHDWDGGKWLNGAPSNCLDWKPRTYTCTICGATRDWNECGSCVKGSKVWIRPQGSNCLEFGVWEITCKYCGEWIQWMSAREASLIAMYPDNPELVAQTMVKIIIDRVNDLCAALE